MTPDQFAKRANKAAVEIQHASTVGLVKGAEMVAKSVEAQAGLATRGTFALRGTGAKRKKGAPKLHPVVKPIGRDGVLVSGKPVGIWSMLDSGTTPHLVGAGAGRSISSNVKTGKTVYTKLSKKGKVSQSSKRKVLKIGDRYVTGPIIAGGSPAHHTFRIGVKQAEARLFAEIRRETAKATTKALHG